jgi:hypothetical protein
MTHSQGHKDTDAHDPAQAEKQTHTHAHTHAHTQRGE